MESTVFTRNNYYPYYIQIKQILLDRINNGIYEYGELLPTETALAKEFSVTRVTLRRALELLRQEGILQSNRGVGWKVIHQRIEQRLTTSYWFGLEVGNTGTATTSETLKAHLINLPKEFEHYFSKELMIPNVYEIVRVRSYKKSPISLEYSYIPEHLAPEIDYKINEKTSLVWLLEHSYGISIGTSTEYLVPKVSDIFESEVLSIQTDSPVFETTRLTYTTNHNLLEIRKSIIRGDMVVFRKDFP